MNAISAPPSFLGPGSRRFARLSCVVLAGSISVFNSQRQMAKGIAKVTDKSPSCMSIR